jgi:hypothetical protein
MGISRCGCRPSLGREPHIYRLISFQPGLSVQHTRVEGLTPRQGKAPPCSTTPPNHHTTERWAPSTPKGLGTIPPKGILS